MAQLRLDFCVPRYVRASERGGSSDVGPSVQEPSIHPSIALSTLLSRDSGMGWPASAKSISLGVRLLLSLQVQTNLGSTNKSFLRPSVRRLSGNLAVSPWMDVRLFGCLAPSFVCGVPSFLLLRLSMCACFYGQYPTALIGAAKRFQADPEPMQCNRRINAPSPAEEDNATC